MGHNGTTPENTQLQKLREQIIKLNNSDEFKQLSRYYKKKSFFNILGISRKETLHSYFLHWLFSPDESHELDDYAIRRLLDLTVLVKNKLQAENEQLQFPSDIEDILICGGYSLDNIVCERERTTTAGDRLDIFISFDFHSDRMDCRINIILENKVRSNEGKEQTNRYFEYGESLEGESIYLFLSPVSNSDFESSTHPVCECKKYIGLNYQYLVDYVLEPCLSECTINDAGVFIEEYLRTLSQPSLQFDDFDGGDIIMAVSSREKELLLNFWENNKDLLTAALNALADNPALEKEERDSIHESLRAVSKVSGKDYSTYLFDGQKFGKGRLVLAVVKKYVADHPGISFDALQGAFSDPRIKVLATVADAEEVLNRTNRRRHFLDDIITLGETRIAVSSEWGAGNIGAFIELAGRLGYSVEPVKQTEEIKAT